MEEYWEYLTKHELTTFKDEELDYNNREHITGLKIAAECGWGLNKPAMTREQWLEREEAPKTPELPKDRRHRSRTPIRTGKNSKAC